MVNSNDKFKNGIICSCVVIIAIMLYCIVEMIVSWCVSYTYFYLVGRIISVACLMIITIVFSTIYKKIGIFPALVCSALMFAIMVDFFVYKKTTVFMAWNSDVNTLRIYPLIIHFEKYRDLSHPQNAWATSDNLDLVRFNTCTITFVMAIIVGIIVLSISLAVKKSKLDVARANKTLRRLMLGLSIFLFVEFMRGVFFSMVSWA
ncbi:MAG: hypothetical protein K2O35_02940 [Clostridia bacterium]|nr:hypothetical protein [Clostridia bacterium]